MNITVNNLGIIFDDERSLVKFLLLDDGALLFGKVKWHKDLMDAYPNIDPQTKVIGAGVVPENITKLSIEDDVWGEWKSTGYGVVTPDEYKDDIEDALKPFEQEINRLWSSNE